MPVGHQVINMITSFAWVQFFHSRFKYFFQTDSLVWEELVSPLSLFPPFGFKFSFRLYVQVSPCQSCLFSVNLIPVGANRKNLMVALCPFWMFQLFHTSLRNSVERLHSNLIYQGSRCCKGESKNKLTSRATRLLQRRNQTQLMFFDLLLSSVDKRESNWLKTDEPLLTWHVRIRAMKSDELDNWWLVFPCLVDSF